MKRWEVSAVLSAMIGRLSYNIFCLALGLSCVNGKESGVVLSLPARMTSGAEVVKGGDRPNGEGKDKG
ncbi:hypothetical protein E2C01_022428 [Portunus trituberculatus]|uniref:Uncharacterized protein n=1 Tax=Portunus trituberculatus TaxID=210409 RepID=A0A5B7E5Z0_PORTR|nr:hypothetical protein [Portunus trituberculatus]